jgi:hypothetical protein
MTYEKLENIAVMAIATAFRKVRYEHCHATPNHATIVGHPAPQKAGGLSCNALFSDHC